MLTDAERLKLLQEQTIKEAALVKYYQQEGRNSHSLCNRFTNSPCLAAIESGTPILDDNCQLCGKQFPTWN